MKVYRNDDGFVASAMQFESLIAYLAGEATDLTHHALEQELGERGRELMLQLLQDHLDLRARREVRAAAVRGSDGIERRAVEPSERQLHTVFGNVVVRRHAYRARGTTNVYPTDRTLNLPAGKHSHGLRERIAREAALCSYDTTVEMVRHGTGQSLGKRQVEGLAVAASKDFNPFYARQGSGPCAADDILVLTVDCKGIVMRPDALRPAMLSYRTKKKLKTRGSRGEVRGRKRMATVGAVYDVAPHPRQAEEVLPRAAGTCKLSATRPKPRNKRYTASITKPLADVVHDLFDEATRRDPDHRRRWVILVDGDWRLLDPLQKEAKQRDVEVQILVDFVHVLEYLWSAAWSFFSEGDALAESWVRKQALALLSGRASVIAGAIRRKATAQKLSSAARKNADSCATYLLRHASLLRYDIALSRGYPIATGVIEGACRHIVKDRMDITGARWSLAGAEAILRLRTLRANGDFDAYWNFHLARERDRVHGELPAAA